MLLPPPCHLLRDSAYSQTSSTYLGIWVSTILSPEPWSQHLPGLGFFRISFQSVHLAFRRPCFFFLTSRFEIILHLQKSDKYSTKNSHIPFTQLPHRINVTHNSGTLIKTMTLTLAQYWSLKDRRDSELTSFFH